MVSLSEKSVSGSMNIFCRYACAYDTGYSIDSITDEKSSAANSPILLNTKGMHNEHIMANTTQITSRVIDAAAQRGNRRPRMFRLSR